MRQEASGRKKWKALVVDDERLAREKLRSQLEAHPQIEIVGEASRASTALELARELKPNLIFLDVQMPGESGFEMVEKLSEPIKIVFVTAFDRYAIRAFEVNAFDYLLKPIEAQRLAQTVAKLDHSPSASASTAVEAAIPENAALDYDDLLFVSAGNHLKFVPVNKIKFIRAAGVYAEIYFADGAKTLVNKSLNHLTERLPERYFLRIHRSVIVNVEYVEKVEPWFNHSFRIFLENVAEPFIASRRCAAQMRNLMI